MKKGLSNFIFIIILLFLFSGCNLLNGLSEITPIIQEDLLNPKIPENYETTLPILLIDANKKMIIDEPKIDATFKLYQDEELSKNKAIEFLIPLLGSQNRLINELKFIF